MSWDKATAEIEIRKFFKTHGVSAKKATASVSSGKVYELYCLVELLDWIKTRYRAHIVFNGATVDFKASPGFVDRSRSYFSVIAGGKTLEVHTDIEVRTLGSTISGAVIDNSAYHEIDIVVIPANVVDGSSPEHDEVLVGVECKSSANLGKSVIRQVLGVRRELSLLSPPQDCAIDVYFGHSPAQLPANPPSHYWLAHTDTGASKYEGSPRAFGVEFKNWSP
ncbi:hypothetical protein [Ruegeria atlantica]|uniref:hypothetical protein n=1 Tax=Ruegeria atlantica TaxID=81569 RepID=UPI00147D250F|nr:hypothetical protein [Ruegeria atlantica]